MNKHFLHSKSFWGCAAGIVTALGEIFTNGPTPGNILTLVTAGFALYGRVVATGPLVFSQPADATQQIDDDASVRQVAQQVPKVAVGPKTKAAANKFIDEMEAK